jgi:hypothetical protein
MTGHTFLGGKLGMAMAVPMTYADVNRANAGSPVTVQQQRNFNLGDIYVAPVVLGWDHGNLHYTGYLGLFAPTGEWHVGELAPTGKNFWSFEPGLAFTYLNPKNGSEASAYVAVDFNSVNRTIDYQSGDDFHIDITLAKHVLRSVLMPRDPGASASALEGAGSEKTAAAPPAPKPVLMDVAPGVCFSCYRQFTGDSGTDALIGPFEGQQFGLGPALRGVASFGKTPVTFQMRILKEFAVQNRPEGVSAWFVTSLKL